MTFTIEPDAEKVLRQPGYLYWNPTNLDEEGNYGTQIGFTEKGVDFDPGIKPVNLTQEESGSEVVFKLFDQEPKVKAVLKSWSVQAIDLLFPGLGESGNVKSPNRARILPGSDLMELYSGRLLFVPWNTNDNNIFILQQCSPNITRSITLSNTVDSNYVVVFDSKRKTEDAQGLYYIGPKSGGILVA